MYAKIVVLNLKRNDLEGGVESVVLGFFDEKGILQLEVPRISGKLFPRDITKGKEVRFEKPAQITNIK